MTTTTRTFSCTAAPLWGTTPTSTDRALAKARTLSSTFLNVSIGRQITYLKVFLKQIYADFFHIGAGLIVSFGGSQGADGKLEAVNVTGPSGECVQGSTYSPDISERSNTANTSPGFMSNKTFNLSLFLLLGMHVGKAHFARSSTDLNLWLHHTWVKFSPQKSLIKLVRA